MRKMKNNNNRPIGNIQELKDNTKKSSTDKVTEYKISGSDEWRKGKIMSTQTKSTGKYRCWLNIIPEKDHEDPICINWNYVNQ